MNRNRSLFDSLGEDQPDRETRNQGSAAPSGTKSRAPLAERMRPRVLEEVVGQNRLLAADGPLRRALAAPRLPSLIFWGPPGTGKTTLARLVAQHRGGQFVPFSAVTSGIKEIKEVMTAAEKWREGQALLLFVDEIHRFNKAQQDAFLPFVERGDVVLMGATTENPSFQLNGALLSRCRVLILEPLSGADLITLLQRALEDSQRGLGELGISAAAGILEEIAQLAGGDARIAMGILELAAAAVAFGGDLESSGGAVAAAGKNQEGVARRVLSRTDVEAAVARKVLLYDRAGEEHFNLISALHKSLRESDPDASVYWLMRMLEAGEEPGYVARRLLRFASEDVGLADPQALGITLAAWQAYERLGSPEGELALVQATLYLALAPKSVAVYRAEKRVRALIRDRSAEPVPLALRNAPTRLMKDVGYGRDYAYAPDTEEGVGGLDCLPPGLSGTRLFEPGGEGHEAELSLRLKEISRRRAEARSRRTS